MRLFAGLGVAGLLAIVVRIAVFVASAQHPIVADRGTLISPAIVSGTDLRFYQAWRHELFSRTNVIGTTVRQRFQHGAAIAGPVYPFLLNLFKYEDGNSWPLAIFYFFVSVILCLWWLWWLRLERLSSASLIMFAVLPHPIYYMLCVGTELPFSLIFAAFFLSYFSARQDRRQVATWMFTLLLLLLTRPNALAVLTFVIVDQFFRHRDGQGLRRFRAHALLVIGLVAFGVMYYSYFTAVFSQEPAHVFFGRSTEQYVTGLFPVLPVWLNRLSSVVLLVMAKTLYLLGIRPSYSSVNMVYVMARVIPGLLFLVGLVFLLVDGDPRHQMLVVLFIVPILFVSSQDRYSVPIQPLLFLYFAKAFDRLFRLGAMSPALQSAA